MAKSLKIALLVLIAALSVQAQVSQKDMKVIGYLGGWSSPPGWSLDSIDWACLTHVIDSFARPLPDGTIDASELRGVPLVSKAHQHNVRCNVSIGGWSYRNDFFAPVQPGVIDTFVSNIYQLVVSGGYDGVDIDWEYPDRGAEGGLPAGSGQFNQLIKKIHDRFNEPSAAAGCDGRPLELAFCQGTYYFREIDWAFVSDYVDYVFVMGYDMNNPYNGPLRNSATIRNSAGTYMEKSVHGVCDYLLNNGIPPGKIVLGAPFYQKPGETRYADVQASLMVTPTNYLGFCTTPGPFPGPAEAKVRYAGSIGYMNDTNSFKYKCEYITNRNLMGLGIWEISDVHPYTNLWDVIRRYTVPKAPVSCGVTIPVKIKGFAPASGCVGDTVVISGSNFLASKGRGFVSFNGVRVRSYNDWTSTNISVVVPPGVTTGRVLVTNYWGFSGTSLSNFRLPGLGVTGFAPVRGCIGDVVAISGSNFGPVQGNGSVRFAGVKVTNYVAWSDTSLSVKIPRITADGVITVSNACGAGGTSAGDFKIFCANPMSHFTVEHDASSGINSPSRIVVRAIDDRDNVKNDFSARVTLFVRANSGEIVWGIVTTNSTFIDCGPGDSRAVFDFRLSEAGTMILTISDNSMESVDIEVKDLTGTWQDDDSDGVLAFVDPNFDPSAVPRAYAYPSVFDKGGTVVFTLVSPSSRIRIYNILGVLVKEIPAGENPRWTPSEHIAGGYYIAVYDDKNGKRVQVRMIYTGTDGK